MSFALLGILLGASFMTETTDPIHVEPGKQLPQKVTVRVGEKPDSREVAIRYMLFAPKDYQADGKKWPLMLFLHGYGECSHDDLSRVKIHGPAKLVDSRPDFPFVLVTPQLPPPTDKPREAFTRNEILELVSTAWKPDELIKLVDHVVANLNIDRQRVYVTGLSMGGYGTWRLVAAYPDRFAAAAPICGGGKPETMARSLARVPIWAFHGAKDETVPLSASENMVEAVRRAGGDVKLTIYPDVEHNSWVPTYDNEKVYDWLLEHRLRK
jgi:predicted peptidase